MVINLESPVNKFSLFLAGRGRCLFEGKSLFQISYLMEALNREWGKGACSINNSICSTMYNTQPSLCPFLSVFHAGVAPGVKSELIVIKP